MCIKARRFKMDYVEVRKNEMQKPSGGMHLGQALRSLNSPGVESPGRQARIAPLLIQACLWMRPGWRCSQVQYGTED